MINTYEIQLNSSSPKLANVDCKYDVFDLKALWLHYKGVFGVIHCFMYHMGPCMILRNFFRLVPIMKIYNFCVVNFSLQFLCIIPVWFPGIHIWHFMTTKKLFRKVIWPSMITKNHIWPSMKSKKVVWSMNWDRT